MKVVHGGSNVVDSHGVSSEANFQIKASAQAFRILSSGLYSDKISAVLREIGCNAADAHIAAGTPDLPIEVKLPTKLDTSFYIKDWGIGLTHEEVTGLFTTYFSSNKGESNDLTGAFGLGSKSPFSYTDSFMVTAVKDGVKRFYTAHIGNDGSPVITMLGDGEPADEDWPNGMMVSFPVQPKDIDEFHLKARRVYRWFRVKPRVLGLEAIEDPKYRIIGSNFMLGPTENEGVKNALVVMGNVAYPLNLQRLGEVDPVISSLVHAHVALTVPIGTVMPTASREELEYDPQTRQNLIEALTGVAKEVAQEVVAQWRKSDQTEWQRMAALREYAAQLPGSISTHIGRFLALSESLDVEQRNDLSKRFHTGYVEFPRFIGPRYDSATRAKSGLRVHLYRLGDRENTVSRREVHEGSVARGSSSERATASYDHDVKVVIGDASHTPARIKEFMLEAGKSKKRVMRISITGVTKDLLKPAEQYAKEIAAALGGVPVISASSIELPQIVRLKQAKAKGARVDPAKLHAKELVKYWGVSSTGRTMEPMKSINLSEVPSACKVYLIEDRRKDPYETKVGSLVCRFSGQEMRKLLELCLSLADAGISMPKLEGVVIGTAAKVRALELEKAGWRDIMSVLYEALTSQPVFGELDEQASKMPVIQLTRHYWAHRNECLLAMLARESARKDSAAWKAFEPVVRQHPELQRMFRELLAAAMKQSQRGNLRRIVDDLRGTWRSLAQPFEELKLLNELDLRSALQAHYPLTAYLDTERLRESADKHPEEAAAALRAALREQPEAAKAARRQDTERTEMQLPLALCG